MLCISKTLQKLLSLEKEIKIIVFTEPSICEATGLRNLLSSNGYTVCEYNDVESFRVTFEERIKPNIEKTTVIVSTEIYVPYDIRRVFHEVYLSARTLFPNLNADTVMSHVNDWDIISFALAQSYSDFTQAKETERFIQDIVFSIGVIEQYCRSSTDKLLSACDEAINYQDWINIANRKASVEYYAAMKNVDVDLSFADEAFQRFISDGYARLSSEVNSHSPPIVTKVLSVILADKNEKSALIVMDGMSLFDFKAISRHFRGIQYEHGCSYALIPTTTPISRQSLLSCKYPRELSKPFSLADEEKEFRATVVSFGFSPTQVDFLRGYDNEISPLSKLIAIVINDVDGIVHGQRQGRAGMFNDMDLLGRSGKLQSLIKRLAALGFAVYITADHGNTLCTGVGGFRSGVEVESRSMRMAILKDFAEANTLLAENATEYQGFYLDKEYRYYICKNGVSFDNKGEVVMTHGGMSIDEVVIPFIRIRSVKENG